MAERTFSIVRCFSDGFAAFRAHIGVAIFGFIVFGLITILVRIPFVYYIYAIFLAAPIEGGLIILLTNLTKNKNPSVGDIFGGFNSYFKFLGAYWLRTAIGMGMMAVFFIPLVLMYRQILPALNNDQAIPPDLLPMLLLAIGVLALGIIVTTIIMFRWVFVFFVIADEPGRYSVSEAFKRSADLTQGNRIGIYVTSLLAGLLALGGVVACGIGLLATIPIAACAMASAYVQLAEADRDGEEGRDSLPAAAAPPSAAPYSAYTAPAGTPPPPPPHPSTWLSPPPEAAAPAMPSSSFPTGQPTFAPPPGSEPAAVPSINLTPHMTPFMEPLRIDQSTVNFKLRDQSSLLANGTPVTSLALSPDGSLIAAAGQDGTVKLWDRYRRALLAEFKAGLLPVDSVAVSPDRQTILAGCRDSDQPDRNLVRAFTTAGGEKNRYEPHTLAVTGLAFSPQGDKVASISWDRSVRVVEVATGAVILTGTHRQRGLAVAFTFDGSHVVSVSQDWTLIAWNISTASAVATWSAQAPGSYQAVLSAGGEWLAVRNETGQASLVEVKSGSTVSDWTAPGKLCALHASAEGSVVAWEAQGNTLRAWHVQGHRSLPGLAGHVQEVDCIAVSPDGMCVVSSGKDGSIAVWDAV